MPRAVRDSPQLRLVVRVTAFEIDETALVVEVPSAEPLVRGLRERYDSFAAYGMPAHVTVLYPFLPRHRNRTAR
ncbi:hypothetical protein [Microbispora sp. GKU 823]|uniref:hypothetical protein n=1 Tax=Microbispora sp. GKU 823 TaxID=1652100 RepID=UPI0009A46448|nr:hypothetical protein [Microbispora sp. GKU 823]